MKEYTVAYAATEDLFSIQDWYDGKRAPAAGNRILQAISPINANSWPNSRGSVGRARALGPGSEVLA